MIPTVRVTAAAAASAAMALRADFPAGTITTSLLILTTTPPGRCSVTFMIQMRKLSVEQRGWAASARSQPVEGGRGPGSLPLTPA